MAKKKKQSIKKTAKRSENKGKGNKNKKKTIARKKKVTKNNKPPKNKSNSAKPSNHTKKKETKKSATATIKTQDKTPKKRGRPRKNDSEKKVRTKRSNIPKPFVKPQYIVKLKIDSKTIIFVKDEKSLKKWKALYPNAEEVL